MDGQNLDDNNSAINISDVIEVIETDTAFGSMQPKRPSSEGLPNTYVRIVEQPASKALRFRYECEGRSAGSLPGVNSTPEVKTFPTIQIVGYQGRAVVVVSCVTKDPPYRPHPHNLVGKEGCKRGVCTVEVGGETMTATFANLGIQCVKKKDIEEALKVREEMRVDPFRTGFAHKTQASGIDLNSVRLCFQAFLEGPQRGKFTKALTPVVSDPIYDKKAMADLVICKLSHSAASVAGGQDVILLCEKVAKEDISVRFFEEKDGKIFWEGYGDFTPTQVHKQTAIAFRTPRYKSLEIDQPVQAFIQLRRPSDGATSEALPFQITPLSGRPFFWSLRRNKANYINFSDIMPHGGKGQVEVENDNNNNSTGVNEDLNDCVMKQQDENCSEVKSDPMKNVIILPDASIDDVENEVNGNFDEFLDHVKSLENMYPDNNNEAEFGIYSSLQLAMKDPCDMLDTPTTEGYEDIAPPRPLKMSSTKEAEEVPPLPPKRAKKSPALPPPPHKNKLNLFQKLFSSTTKRKKKQRESSREGSVVSRISERSHSLAPSRGDVDLTEAEHYALYTSVAPRATASEFDEMSFYYSPIERPKVN
ncbi:putative transcription factor p65 homolog isoform X2 [Halyomorpha halys]|nr:embryonic polarity protein dorsal-like isoform X2 [Halyomorpha halys]